MTAPIRKFDTGATRDTDADKLDFEGFLSPLVLERYAEYMHKNQKQSDGSLRDSDNWQKGIPMKVYAKSLWRHFHKWWKRHRRFETDESLEDSLCAVIFNASGYLHEVLRRQDAYKPRIWPQPLIDDLRAYSNANPSAGVFARNPISAWSLHEPSRCVDAYDAHPGYPLGSDAE